MMLHVPEQNIIEAEDFTYDEMLEINLRMTQLCLSRTRDLSLNTGILGTNNLTGGLPWDRVKVRAMLKDAPNDYIIVRISSLKS